MGQRNVRVEDLKPGDSFYFEGRHHIMGRPSGIKTWMANGICEEQMMFKCHALWDSMNAWMPEYVPGKQIVFCPFDV